MKILVTVDENKLPHLTRGQILQLVRSMIRRRHGASIYSPQVADDIAKTKPTVSIMEEAPKPKRAARKE